jgi:hypothetical protein
MGESRCLMTWNPSRGLPATRSAGMAIALALSHVGRDPLGDVSDSFQRPTLCLLKAGQILVDLAHQGIMPSCHGRTGVSQGYG